ncbi:NADPH-dependent glutamate synthase [Limnochorda sp.]|uniref:NADPH-dependent glutamate synthase n=1 Tax=Limnochorda sp. TaxID=1940279 RepID=UPI0039C3F0E7
MGQTYRWDQVPLRQLPLEARLATFAEVNQGYTYEEAVLEAQRCLQCPSPACQDGCPNGNPIRDFIDLLAEGDLAGAIELDWTRNALPSCTGRVCAWELQCEGFCVMGERGDPIRIGALERFIADWAAENLDLLQLVDTEYRPRAQRVAVVGAGPAGLAVSHFLARKGYPVTVFEAWALPGGVMAYGIPEYVLPQQVIDREVARLEALGVEFRTGVRVGRDLTLDELLQTYDAVFVGTGANEPATLGIPGEELEGVWTAKEFLMRVQASQMADRLADRLPAEEMSPPRVGQRVAVVGAGNTAMDAARTARRLGADEVTVVYRRDEAQSPSRPVEIDHAKTEGVRFQYLVNPVRFLGDEAGRLRAMELIRMELGPPDGSGRPRPVPVPGSEFQMPVDTVIVAVGYAPERELAARGGLATTSWGGLVVDEATGATSRPGVFAAGDCVTGAKTVIHAIAGARRAAEAMERYLEARGAGHAVWPPAPQTRDPQALLRR